MFTTLTSMAFALAINSSTIATQDNITHYTVTYSSSSAVNLTRQLTQISNSEITYATIIGLQQRSAADLRQIGVDIQQFTNYSDAALTAE